MTNLLTVLPDFDLQPHSRILPPLEKALVSAADLLTLDPLDIAKRAQIPPGDVKALADAVSNGLGASLRPSSVTTAGAGNGSGSADGNNNGPIALTPGTAFAHSQPSISTFDDHLDAVLHGGISSGCLTEIVGESAVGKTQFLLTLLLAVQLPPPRGLGKSALYISTEAPLQTTRLHQILTTHPKLCSLPELDRPSLSRIQSTHIHDVEAQEHILRYQVPVAVRNHNIGLVVIDSIAANYRAEFEKGNARQGAGSFARRNVQVAQLGALLRNLAETHQIAVVVANQVADRFAAIEPSSQSLHGSQDAHSSWPVSPGQTLATRPAPLSPGLPSDISPTSTTMTLSTDDPLALDHQQRFFTGWGDDPLITNLKTPSLGLSWTNQLAARIALLKQPIYEVRNYLPGEERDIAGWDRQCKVVFSTWCAESTTPFEIWEGGVRRVDLDAERDSGQA